MVSGCFWGVFWYILILGGLDSLLVSWCPVASEWPEITPFFRLEAGFRVWQPKRNWIQIKTNSKHWKWSSNWSHHPLRTSVFAIFPVRRYTRCYKLSKRNPDFLRDLDDFPTSIPWFPSRSPSARHPSDPSRRGFGLPKKGCHMQRTAAMLIRLIQLFQRSSKPLHKGRWAETMEIHGDFHRFQAFADLWMRMIIPARDSKQCAEGHAGSREGVRNARGDLPLVL